MARPGVTKSGQSVPPHIYEYIIIYIILSLFIYTYNYIYNYNIIMHIYTDVIYLLNLIVTPCR